MRSLTLLVRNLATCRIANTEKRFPALDTLLSRGTLAAALGGTIAGWACTSFGVKRQRDWPIGPILAQAHGVLRNSTFWICAQPVHLAIDGNGLFLRPYSELHLSSDESQMLFSFLQSRLAEHDLEMAHIDTGLWCIGTRGRHKLSTVDIDWAVHRRVDSLLPSGEDAAWWQRLLVEVQMSLHEHPLNLAREERGQVSVNSIWLWGGGTVPVVRRHFDKICVFDPVLRAIALMSQAQQIDLPANVEESMVDAGRTLVEFNVPDKGRMDESLSVLDSGWIASAWSALTSARLDELSVVLPLPNAVVVCYCDGMARRRFWRRKQTLQQLLSRWQIGS